MVAFAVVDEIVDSDCIVGGMVVAFVVVVINFRLQRGSL